MSQNNSCLSKFDHRRYLFTCVSRFKLTHDVYTKNLHSLSPLPQAASINDRCLLLCQGYRSFLTNLWLPQFKLSIFTVGGDQVIMGVMFHTNHIFVMNLKFKQNMQCKSATRTFGPFIKAAQFGAMAKETKTLIKITGNPAWL